MAPRIPTDFCERLFAAMVPFYQCDINNLLEFTGRLDETRLREAFLAALAEEPMWAHRWVTKFWSPYWAPIPRAERRALVRVVETDGSYADLGRILSGPVTAAAKVLLLRGPRHDALCVRVDHRLADATAARFLVESLHAHYQAGATEPAGDAPVVRRTISLLRTVVSEEQRKKNFDSVRAQARAIRKRPSAYQIPPATPQDPAELPPLLRYPAGAVDELTARAMRDRATATIALMAASYLAVRDVAGIRPQAPVTLVCMVNLRRYLPPAERRAGASMLIGQIRPEVQEEGSTTMAAVIPQIRAALDAERGPNFGLRFSPLSLDVPHVRSVVASVPFGLLRWGLARGFRNPRKSPDLAVSELGEFGRPGDRWGDAVLADACSLPGTWGIPSVSICSSTCGSRLTLAVGVRPRSFAEALTRALAARLADYVGWPADHGEIVVAHAAASASPKG